MNPFTQIDDEVRMDLSAILTEVLFSLLAEEACASEDPLPTAPLAISRLAIHDLNIDSYALVEVQVGLPLAHLVATHMLSLPRPATADVVDAVAEFGNIAGGNVKTMLCRRARLSLPGSWIGEPRSTTQLYDGGVQVRAMVLGQVAQLAIHPDVAIEGLIWPPRSSDEILERSP